MALNKKQQIFIAEYLSSFNATKAAIAAGYSEKTAGSIGNELLKKPEIAKEINEKVERKCDELEITSENVLKELYKLAFSNISDFIIFDDDGNMSVSLHKATKDQLSAITEIHIDTKKYPDGTAIIEKTRFKLADKGINLERLGRHLKLFTDTQEVKSNFTIVIDAKDAKSL